tara:strand:- start:568 stop:1014 length:447 start_codon:yes stop_codon:yes gene_type:complete
MKTVKVNKVLSLIIIIFFYTLGFGGDSKEIYPFDDNLQEEIFQSLLNEIRCPKCQSSNLAGSNSPIANDIKREVYRLVRSGQTEEEVKTYLVQRYGNFIVYDPPFSTDTIFLWFGPLIIFLLTLSVILVMLWKKFLIQKKSKSKNLIL